MIGSQKSLFHLEVDALTHRPNGLRISGLIHDLPDPPRLLPASVSGEIPRRFPCRGASMRSPQHAANMHSFIHNSAHACPKPLCS